VLGASSIAFLTASTAIVQIEAAPEMRGRVLALQAMLFLGSTPIGGPIVGWVSQAFGARYAIALGAVAALGAGTWGMSKVRSASRDRTTSDADVIVDTEVVSPVS
jgi:MFS family permease